MKKIKILVIYPNKQPTIEEIKGNEEGLYGLVYFPYEQIELEKDIYLIYSKEAKENEFPLCRIYKGKKIVIHPRINKIVIGQLTLSFARIFSLLITVPPSYLRIPFGIQKLLQSLQRI